MERPNGNWCETKSPARKTWACRIGNAYRIMGRRTRRRTRRSRWSRPKAFAGLGVRRALYLPRNESSRWFQGGQVLITHSYRPRLPPSHTPAPFFPSRGNLPCPPALARNSSFIIRASNISEISLYVSLSLSISFFSLPISSLQSSRDYHAWELMLVVQRKLLAEIPDSDSDIIADTCKLRRPVRCQDFRAIGKPFTFSILSPVSKSKSNSDLSSKRNFSPSLKTGRTIAKGCFIGVFKFPPATRSADHRGASLPSLLSEC